MPTNPGGATLSKGIYWSMEAGKRDLYPKVLVFEPHRLMHKYLLVNLEIRNYSVVEATTLASIRPLAEARQPAAMILSLSPYEIERGILIDIGEDSVLSRIPVILLLTQNHYDFVGIEVLPPNVTATFPMPVPTRQLFSEVARIVSRSSG